MVENYFKTSVRSISRHKFYAALNILGFSLGVALFIFISLFLYDQFSYDRWYENHSRIYRVEFGEWGILGPVYGRVIHEYSAEVEKTLRMNNNWGHNATVLLEDKQEALKIPHLIMADSTVFDFFDFTFIHGTPQHALNDKNSIVLTRSQAERLFGTTQVVGEVIRLDNNYNLLVTGVIEDINRFHIRVDAIGNFALFGDIYSPSYLESTGEWNHLTYVKLHPDADAVLVEQALDSHLKDFILERLGIDFDYDANLRPVADIYFTNTIPHETMVLHGNKTTSLAFLAIAVFILCIAIINFVNLSTARSAGRARETGIRKLLGSDRGKLILQFITESVGLTVIAVVLAFALVEVMLPWFNYVADTNIALKNFGYINLFIVFMLGAVIIGIVSGVYPAFYLSAFQPAETLRGSSVKGKGAALFRKVLIVFQFSVSVALIAGTMIVYEQLQFMKSRETGFEKENILHFQTNARVRQNWDSFRQALLSHPSIQEVALSNSLPGSVFWQEGLVVDGEARQFTFWPMTPEYFSMMELELLAGRAFTRDNPTDQGNAVVVNQQWLRLMGLSGEPYSQVIHGEVAAAYGNYRIVGIIPDFHYNSLHQPVGPLVMIWGDRALNMASVKLHGGNHSDGREHIQNTWRAYSPDELLEYGFLDHTLEKLYDRESRLGMLFVSFSAFAVIIACLGLFGLASFMVEKRSKEIAIRKVLGASIMSLLKTMSKEFLLLVGVSLLFAVPLSYYAMSRWLDTFALRIDLAATPFVVASLLALVLTLLTVGYHVLKSSATNPVEPLRND